MNSEFDTRIDLSTKHLIKVILSVIFIQALKYLSHSEQLGIYHVDYDAYLFLSTQNLDPPNLNARSVILF